MHEKKYVQINSKLDMKCDNFNFVRMRAEKTALHSRNTEHLRKLLHVNAYIVLRPVLNFFFLFTNTDELNANTHSTIFFFFHLLDL